MKKITALSVFAAICVCSVPAFGTAFYDGFNYTPVTSSNTNLGLGNGTHVNKTVPATQNGFTDANVWTAYGSNANLTDANIVPGSLSYPGLPASTGNMINITNDNYSDRIGIGTDYGAGAGGSVVYYSLIMRVADMTGMTSTGQQGGFIAGLQYYPDQIGDLTRSSGGGSPFGAPLLIRRADSSNLDAGYQVGVGFRDSGGGTINTTFLGPRVFDSSTNYTTSDTLFCVVKYDMGDPYASNDDSATLWVFQDDGTSADPIPVSEPITYTAKSFDHTVGSGINDLFWNDTGTPGSQVDANVRSLVVRSPSTFTPDGLDLDEIRAGSTWSDVTAAEVTVAPEPGSLSMLGLAWLGLLERRRRRQ